MIAQRSAFTIHGKNLGSISAILVAKNITVSDCLYSYEIDEASIDNMLYELSYLGITHASIFPDLDHLCKDIAKIAKNP